MMDGELCLTSTRIRPPRFLGDLLPTARALVVTLPRSNQTSGIVGTDQIGRMRWDAVLVDIGGGGVVNEIALVEGLRQGQPSAAVLDSFASEPLPPQSALWGPERPHQRTRGRVVGAAHRAYRRVVHRESATVRARRRSPGSRRLNGGTRQVGQREIRIG